MRMWIVAYALNHLDELLDQARDQRRSLAQRTGLPFTDDDIFFLRGWRVHVTGDFFVEGFLPEGAVLVRGADAREEVFVVKSLASPFTELLAPGAGKDDPASFPAVYTVLLPVRVPHRTPRACM
jgi:hypothetical protein